MTQEINNAKYNDKKIWTDANVDPRTVYVHPKDIKNYDERLDLKPNIKKVLRIMDEQTAINRFTWYNLPSGLTGQMIERILYYRGQGMFFYVEELGEFFFLPYCLDGSIDIYGRYTGVRPLPFNGSTETKKDDKLNPIAKYVTSLIREPLYDIWLGEVNPDVLKTKCVLLSDYSKQISQTNIPRQLLNDPLLDVMSDCVPFLRTALLNGTGIQGLRVNDASEARSVLTASAAVDNAALTGQKYIPMTGHVEFQDLTGGEVAKAEEYLLSMQSLDNLRLSTYGLDNGGLFQKKSHMLQSEQEVNVGTTGLIMQDGLTLRQEFCNIVNSLTGWGVECVPSENVLEADMNMDGMVGDNYDQSGFGNGMPQEVANE